MMDVEVKKQNITIEKVSADQETAHKSKKVLVEDAAFKKFIAGVKPSDFILPK